MTQPAPVILPGVVPAYSQDAPYQKSLLTVADMIAQVTRQFGDEANVQINNTDIIRWINMGLVEISRNNRVWEKTAIIYSTVPDFSGDGTTIDPANYVLPLPNDCMMLQAVKYNGMILPGFDFEQLISTVNQDMNVKGTPQCYYTWSGGIFLYPYPDTAGLNIVIYYRGIPPLVSTQTDTISIPDKYFDTLESFVMAKAYELDEDWQGQATKRNEFTQSLSTLSEETDAYAGDFFTITDPAYEYPGGW
jgi:hypothetical protein